MMLIIPVRPVDLVKAFGLLRGYSLTEAECSAEYVQHFLGDEQYRNNILGAYEGNTICGCVHAQCLPGSVAVVGLPQTRPTNSALDDALVRAAIAHVADARILQSFLTSQEWPRAGPLLRNGFQHVTSIWQMEWQHQPVPPPRTPIELRPFAECCAERFQDVLVRCHEGTLDCPELNGLRTPSEVFAGHHDAAPNTARWWLVEHKEQPVGVLLMNGEEISFLGLLPEWRRRGIGRSVLTMAAERSSTKMTLIVDVRNQPAIELYHSFGFAITARYEVLLLVR